MKPIEELLRNLARPEVLEFGLVTNRLPSVNVGGRFEPVDDEACTTDRLLQMLVTMGGSRYVESLSDKPVQWTTKLDGVGVIHVAAIMRRDVVQARFTVARRDGGTPGPAPVGRPSAAPAAAASIAPPKVVAAPARPLTPSAPPQSTPARSVPPVRPAQPSVAPAASPPPAPVAPAAPTRSVAPPPAVVAPPVAPPPAVVAPPVAPPPAVVAPPVAPPPTASVPPSGPPVTPVTPSIPPSEEWDDDDEPTVQTTSPPVRGSGLHDSEAPKPKPARRPEETAASPVAVAPPPLELVTPLTPLGPELPRDTARQLGTFAAEASARASVTPPAGDEDVPESRPEARAAPSPETVASAPPPPPPAATAAEPASLRPAPPLPSAVAAPASLRPAPPLPSAVAAPAPAPESAIASSRGPRRHPTPTSVDAPKLEAERAKQPSAAKLPAAPRDAEPLSLEALLAVVAGAHGPRPEALHLVAGRPALARVATDLVPRTPPIGAETFERLLDELLPPSRRAQLEAEGACEVVFAHDKHGRLLVRASRHAGGHRLLLRALPRETPTAATLGLPEPAVALAAGARGLVVVAAPRGGGRTSTLAALVEACASTRRVAVVESRSEVLHTRRIGLVTQHVVGPDGDAATFEDGAELAARCDADVVVLDADAVDPRLVRAALELVEAGKLVVLGLPCATASRAVDRLLDAFVAAERAALAERLASALSAVLGVRLVPSADRARLWPAFELVPSSLPLYGAVREGRPGAVTALLVRTRPPGGIRVEESLAELVRAQKVTLEVARGHADQTSELEALAAGRKV